MKSMVLVNIVKEKSMNYLLPAIEVLPSLCIQTWYQIYLLLLFIQNILWLSSYFWIIAPLKCSSISTFSTCSIKSQFTDDMVEIKFLQRFGELNLYKLLNPKKQKLRYWKNDRQWREGCIQQRRTAFRDFSLNWIILLSQPIGVAELKSHINSTWARTWDCTKTEAWKQSRNNHNARDRPQCNIYVRENKEQTLEGSTPHAK